MAGAPNASTVALRAGVGPRVQQLELQSVWELTGAQALQHADLGLGILLPFENKSANGASCGSPNSHSRVILASIFGETGACQTGFLMSRPIYQHGGATIVESQGPGARRPSQRRPSPPGRSLDPEEPAKPTAPRDSPRPHKELKGLLCDLLAVPPTWLDAVPRCLTTPTAPCMSYLKAPQRKGLPCLSSLCGP